MAALAASAVFGMTALTSCGEPATEVEGDAAGEVEVDPCAADPCAADPCAAKEDPCAADPCAADPCAAE
ncbi:MAG: hypothetical protein AAGM27_12300, partial [Cyanobacteria bacterium J06554_3]